MKNVRGFIIAITLLGVIGTIKTNPLLQRKRKENGHKRKSVERLYNKWYSDPLRKALTKKSRASRLSGRWAKSRVSKAAIRPFIKKYSINTEEMARPVKSFRTFNDFFIRKLKPGARPIATDPNTIISPADGSALVMQNIDSNTLFPTKTVDLSAAKVLGDKNLAKTFEGGTAFIIRLAPWDYHRVHFPLTGVPGMPYTITGRYESVSPEVYKAGIQPLEINERHIIKFQSDKASTVAMVLVGALFVGAIVETYAPNKKYERGEELGYFEYGGSTMVMFFQKDTIHVLPEIVADSKEGKETPVKMGQVIGHVMKKKPTLPPGLSTWDV